MAKICKAMYIYVWMNTIYVHGCMYVRMCVLHTVDGNEIMRTMYVHWRMHLLLHFGWAKTQHFLWVEPGHSSHPMPLHKVQKPLERDLQFSALGTVQLKEAQMQETSTLVAQAVWTAMIATRPSIPAKRPSLGVTTHSWLTVCFRCDASCLLEGGVEGCGSKGEHAICLVIGLNCNNGCTQKRYTGTCWQHGVELVNT